MRILGFVLFLALPAAAEQKSTVDVLTRGQQISTAVAAGPFLFIPALISGSRSASC